MAEMASTHVVAGTSTEGTSVQAAAQQQLSSPVSSASAFPSASGSGAGSGGPVAVAVAAGGTGGIISPQSAPHTIASSHSPSDGAVAPVSAPRNVYVGGMPPHWKDQDLASCFAQFGEVELTKILIDTMRHSRGAGFVHFRRHESALSAIHHLNGFIPADAVVDPQTGGLRALQVKFAHEKKDPGEKKENGTHGKNGPSQRFGHVVNGSGVVVEVCAESVYVAGLPRHFTRQTVESLFSPFGRVAQVKILTDGATEQSRGIAFVKFERRADATRAIGEMDGLAIEGADLPIQVRWAKERHQTGGGGGGPASSHMRGHRFGELGLFYGQGAGAGGMFASPFAAAGPHAHHPMPHLMMQPFGAYPMPIMSMPGHHAPGVPHAADMYPSFGAHGGFMPQPGGPYFDATGGGFAAGPMPIGYAPMPVTFQQTPPPPHVMQSGGSFAAPPAYMSGPTFGFDGPAAAAAGPFFFPTQGGHAPPPPTVFMQAPPHTIMSNQPVQIATGAATASTNVAAVQSQSASATQSQPAHPHYYHHPHAILYQPAYSQQPPPPPHAQLSPQQLHHHLQQSTSNAAAAAAAAAAAQQTTSQS